MHEKGWRTEAAADHPDFIDLDALVAAYGLTVVEQLAAGLALSSAVGGLDRNAPPNTHRWVSA